jgi:hypothetical protein
VGAAQVDCDDVGGHGGSIACSLEVSLGPP